MCKQRSKSENNKSIWDEYLMNSRGKFASVRSSYARNGYFPETQKIELSNMPTMWLLLMMIYILVVFIVNVTVMIITAFLQLISYYMYVLSEKQDQTAWRGRTLAPPQWHEW